MVLFSGSIGRVPMASQAGRASFELAGEGAGAVVFGSIGLPTKSTFQNRSNNFVVVCEHFGRGVYQAGSTFKCGRRQLELSNLGFRSDSDRAALEHQARRPEHTSDPAAPPPTPRRGHTMPCPLAGGDHGTQGGMCCISQATPVPGDHCVRGTSCKAVATSCPLYTKVISEILPGLLVTLAILVKSQPRS